MKNCQWNFQSAQFSQSLITDLRQITAPRRSCMIYELYQRFRTLCTENLGGAGCTEGWKET